MFTERYSIYLFAITLSSFLKLQAQFSFLEGKKNGSLVIESICKRIQYIYFSKLQISSSLACHSLNIPGKKGFVLWKEPAVQHLRTVIVPSQEWILEILEDCRNMEGHEMGAVEMQWLITVCFLCLLLWLSLLSSQENFL